MGRCPTLSMSLAVDGGDGGVCGERGTHRNTHLWYRLLELQDGRRNSGAVGVLCLLRCYGTLSKAKNILTSAAECGLADCVRLGWQPISHDMIPKAVSCIRGCGVARGRSAPRLCRRFKQRCAPRILPDTCAFLMCLQRERRTSHSPWPVSYNTQLASSCSIPAIIQPATPTKRTFPSVDNSHCPKNEGHSVPRASLQQASDLYYAMFQPWLPGV